MVNRSRVRTIPWQWPSRTEGRNKHVSGYHAVLARTIYFATDYPRQVEQGAITGVVTDASGALIPKAKVSATNQATGVVATAETTDEGYYKIPYLLPGNYNAQLKKKALQ